MPNGVAGAVSSGMASGQNVVRLDEAARAPENLSEALHSLLRALDIHNATGP